MIVCLQVTFWLLFVLAIYSYFIYPFVLMLLPDRAVQEFEKTRPIPSMSIIVTVHNEERRIRDKLENLIDLPPYRGDVEIIVASDASSDNTDAIVSEYRDQGIGLVRNPEHDGKEAAQALAIDAANGEILVFSDVATMMRGDVLERISAHFSDPSVGAISSTDQFIDHCGQSAGEGMYIRYEMWLRRQESRVSSLIGLSGSFFAARAEICRKKWPTTIPSDLMTAINCVRQGFVAVSADDVIGYYEDLADPSKEFQRKVRTVVRGMRALAETTEVLNPARYGMFAFQMWSHKVLRWLVPWCLSLVLMINMALLNQHQLYRAALLMQIIFYGLAMVGWTFRFTQRFVAVRIPYFFLVTNMAVMHATVDFFRGRAVVTWVPSER